MTANALRSAIFLLFFLAVSISAQAKNQSSDAHLSGTLLDSSGAAVGGVNVTAQLEGNATARLWKTISSTDGAYSLALPPGRYHRVVRTFAVCFSRSRS